MNHEDYIRRVLDLASQAAAMGEVPVAALLVDNNGDILSEAINLRETASDPTAHAELKCLQDAGKKTGNWQLNSCTLYVNLEPCVMCMGAIVNARIKRLVFSAFDHKGGSISNHIFHPSEHNLNHRVEVISGILEEESRELLQSFFRNLRDRKK